MVIVFGDLSESHISELWGNGAKRDGWPDTFTTAPKLQQYIREGQQDSIFARGEVKGIWLNDTLAGFVTLHEIEPGFTEPNADIFEGGTFLLPKFRGFGLNEAIKNHIISTAFHTYHASCCVFCIPLDNQRAIHAIEKLTLPFERITTANSDHFLYRYLKWKSWKTGKRFIFYVIKRNPYT